ncbi:MAG: DUF1080 domain-containing protein, partial [Lewinellaceae bacterium]|nr:DUF1080 domain-containing protein [Lewinellaceae bacterium]
MKKISLTSFGAVFILMFVTSIALAAPGDGWRTLFNGKTLDGWEVKNGKAEYVVRDGSITGITRMNTPNTFLCTKEHFGDFILELEVWGDAALNSGIQFRSNSLPEYQDGRVHGYQAEVDPSQRAYSGGIYDEARRGWLYPLSLNPEGQKAYQVGQWNQYHIEAVGPELRIWVNGVNTANVVDDMTASGFIGLQVHSIGSEEQAGREIRWRNIRIKTEGLEAERWPMAPHAPELNYIPNTLTQYEKDKGWRLLWDGKTANGWRSARSDEFPAKGWMMKDGVLTVLESGGEESENGGDIVTRDQFSNFELKVEFRITEGANSGIKYFVDPELNKGAGSAIGLEYQILDDEKHPDAKMGVNGNRTLASLYDLIPAENLSVPGNEKVFRGVGEWNQAHIIVRDNRIEHWLNGFKVVEYERNTPMYRALVAYSKYKVWPNFGEAPQGHILLQDHGNRVSFR